MFVERQTWNKHVAVREAGVGVVTFLQNHNSVPHVAVHKVNTEVGATFSPAPAALDGALHQTYRLWEGYLIELGFRWIGGCSTILPTIQYRSGTGGALPVNQTSGLSINMVSGTSTFDGPSTTDIFLSYYSHTLTPSVGRP